MPVVENSSQTIAEERTGSIKPALPCRIFVIFISTFPVERI